MKWWLTTLMLLAAISTEAAEVVMKSPDGRVQAHLKIKWRFAKRESGADVLYAFTQVPLGSGIRALGVSGSEAWFDPGTSQPGQLSVGLTRLHNTLYVSTNAGSSPQTMQLDVVLEQTVVVERGCAANDLFVRLENDKVPTFLGVSCQRNPNGIVMTTSVPVEIELNSSTLFESAGKGERWRRYEVSDKTYNADQEAMARFEYRRPGDSVPWRFSVYHKTSHGAGTSDESPVEAHVEAGMVQISTKAAGSASAVDPLIAAGFVSRRLFGLWRGLADFTYGIPLKTDSYFQAGAGFGPFFKTSSFELGLIGEYMALGVDQNLSGSLYSFRMNEFGAGLRLDTSLARESIWGLLVDYVAFGGSDKALGFSLSYRRTASQHLHWGVALGYQSESASDPTFGSVSFTQLGLKLRFEL